MYVSFIYTTVKSVSVTNFHVRHEKEDATRCKSFNVVIT